MEKKILITIARQYGSGGREIGERIAALLSVPLYDRELITHVSEAGALHPDVCERVDERATSSLLYTLAMGSGFHAVQSGAIHLPVNDRLFMAQSDYIRARAEEGSGVFIGRCADYVLHEEAARFSVFVYAPLAERCRRVMLRHPDLGERAALDLINKTDRRRSSYYGFYTGEKWGKYDNYHIAVDSSLLGIEQTAVMLAEAAKVRCMS